MNLYCWPCKTNHDITSLDAEKIVYTLGAMIPDAASEGLWGDETQAEQQATGDPDCLLEVLQSSNSSDGYSEIVEQGIESRKATESVHPETQDPQLVIRAEAAAGVAGALDDEDLIIGGDEWSGEAEPDGDRVTLDIAKAGGANWTVIVLRVESLVQR